MMRKVWPVILLVCGALMFLTGSRIGGLIIVALGAVFLAMPASAVASWREAVARQTAIMQESDEDLDEDEGEEEFEDEDDDEDPAEIMQYDLIRHGIECEKSGDVDTAVRYYEVAVHEKAGAPHPYRRLAIIYRKRKQWQDVVRVCDAALVNLEGHVGKYCRPEEYLKRKAEAQSHMEG